MPLTFDEFLATENKAQKPTFDDFMASEANLQAQPAPMGFPSFPSVDPTQMQKVPQAVALPEQEPNRQNFMDFLLGSRPASVEEQLQGQPEQIRNTPLQALDPRQLPQTYQNIMGATLQPGDVPEVVRPAANVAGGLAKLPLMVPGFIAGLGQHAIDVAKRGDIANEEYFKQNIQPDIDLVKAIGGNTESQERLKQDPLSPAYLPLALLGLRMGLKGPKATEIPKIPRETTVRPKPAPLEARGEALPMPGADPVLAQIQALDRGQLSSEAHQLLKNGGMDELAAAQRVARMNSDELRYMVSGGRLGTAPKARETQIIKASEKAPLETRGGAIPPEVVSEPKAAEIAPQGLEKPTPGAVEKPVAGATQVQPSGKIGQLPEKPVAEGLEPAILEEVKKPKGVGRENQPLEGTPQRPAEKQPWQMKKDEYQSFLSTQIDNWLKLINESVDALDYSEKEVYALRGDNFIPKKKFKASREWIDGIKSGPKLDGISTIEIAENGPFGDNQISREGLESAIETAKEYGKNVYLIKGKRIGQGSDDFNGEVILRDHKILGILKSHRIDIIDALKEGKLTPAEAERLGHFRDYPELKPPSFNQPAGQIEPRVINPKTESISSKSAESASAVSPVESGGMAPTKLGVTPQTAGSAGQALESTLSIRTEAEAIAKKLTDDFGELSEYRTMNMAEQAQLAQKTLDADYAKAKKMAMGEEAPPPGLREASIYEAVKIRALKEGDVETLRQLAVESKIPSRLSEYGQAIKAADTGIMNDPVRAMQDVSKVRAERSERTGKRITNEEITRLRTEVDNLQKSLKDRVNRVTRKSPVKYGESNKIVGQAAYEVAKRALAQSFASVSANPMLDPALVSNMVKVGTYHMEAGTRVFAEWSGRMVSDLGEKIKPHLDDLWKQIQNDRKLQIAIKAQKTRLANEAEALAGKLETLDLTKQEKRAIGLDPEAQKLKRARDRAKENYNAAVNASGTITHEEAQNIVHLSQATERARVAMESGGRDKTGQNYNTSNRIKYGAARVAYENYVNDLKSGKLSIKNQLRETGREFKTTWQGHKAKAVYNIGKDALNTTVNNSISMVATLDDSFLGRQGKNTLMTHPTVWANGARNSFIDFAKTIGGKNAHDALMADVYSRDYYLDGSYQKAGILPKTEEQFPTSLPEPIPGIGRVFKASEYAFTGSAIRMRTGIFDLLANRTKKNGVNVSDALWLKDTGKMINSLTARGQWGQRGEPAVVRILLWAPKMLKGNLDVLTMHNLGVGLDTPFARKQAAINLLKIVGETATIMTIANALKPGSAETNPKSSDFGKIKVGDTRFDITGGMGSIVVLATRIATGERKSTMTGQIIPYSNKFGQVTRFDALTDFLVGKTTPPTRVIFDWLKGKDYRGDPFSLLTSTYRATTPISIQQAIQLKDGVSADRVAGVILDGLGISSYSVDKSKNNIAMPNFAPFNRKSMFQNTFQRRLP